MGRQSLAGLGPIEELLHTSRVRAAQQRPLGARANPIHLIFPLKTGRLPQGAVAFLADMGARDQLTFVTPFSEARAAELQAAFRKDLRTTFKLPEDLANKLVVTGAGTRASMPAAIKKIAGGDQGRTVGVLDKSLGFLQNKIGYIRGTDRLHNDRLDEDTALLLSAMLLRNQFPDHYAVRNIRKEIESRGLDFKDISQRVGQLIAAIRHIATMA